MVDAAQQGRGTGSTLIADCKQALRAEQFKTLRLAIDEGNPQSKAFWQKNGFALTGQRTPNENGAYLPWSVNYKTKQKACAARREYHLPYAAHACFYFAVK